MPTQKTKRQRDYKAEYRRRIARGKARGLSLSQARGHRKPEEEPLRQPQPVTDQQLKISLKALRKGASITEAAKQARISAERFRNHAHTSGLIEKRSGRWSLRPNLTRRLLIFSEGQEKHIFVATDAMSSLVGQYMSAVGQFQESLELELLDQLMGLSVDDSQGESHPLETDPNVILRLINTGSEPFEQVYQLIGAVA